MEPARYARLCASVPSFAGLSRMSPGFGARSPDLHYVGRDGRMFPIGFQRHLLHERVGVDALVVSGGHLVALAKPGRTVRDSSSPSRCLAIKLTEVGYMVVL
jgi:hypothetical protein